MPFRSRAVCRARLGGQSSKLRLSATLVQHGGILRNTAANASYGRRLPVNRAGRAERLFTSAPEMPRQGGSNEQNMSAQSKNSRSGWSFSASVPVVHGNFLIPFGRPYV
jgi:hypothetical protein